ncbi:MAG: class I SAM-dependent methyltransferase [Hormoscilla sp.]
MVKKTQEWIEKKQIFLEQEDLQHVQKDYAQRNHIEGKIVDGRLGQFHKDVHSLTYDPDRLERAYDKYAHEYDELLLELAGDGTSGCSHYTTLFFSRVVPIQKNLRILDAGVGTGIGGVELINLGYTPLEIVGVDLSSKMLVQAEKRGVYEALHHARFPETGDILQSDEFDAVLCAGGFSHSAMPEVAMPEFARVTRPGGFVVFSVRQSVYEESNSQMKAMVSRLEEARVWDVVAQECGAYLPADGVKAVYIACRVC